MLFLSPQTGWGRCFDRFRGKIEVSNDSSAYRAIDINADEDAAMLTIELASLMQQIQISLGLLAHLRFEGGWGGCQVGLTTGHLRIWASDNWPHDI